MRSNRSQNTTVFLHVYDLHQANNYGYIFGLGAFHTGVEVNGREYAFGGHEYSFTGVFDIAPKTAYGAIFRETVVLGQTSLSRSEIQKVLDDLSLDFLGNTYHPFTRNCNTFSNEFSMKLLNVPIPSYINRLPFIGSIFSCVLPNNGLQLLGLAPPSPQQELPPAVAASEIPSRSLSPRSSPLSPRHRAMEFTGIDEATGQTVHDTEDARREKLSAAAYKRLNSSKDNIT